MVAPPSDPICFLPDQTSDNFRRGTPDSEIPDDDDEAKLLFEFLADKHGFQSKDSTPDGDGENGKTGKKSKTFEEWKADRLKKKSKSQEQEEQVAGLTGAPYEVPEIVNHDS